MSHRRPTINPPSRHLYEDTVMSTFEATRPAVSTTGSTTSANTGATEPASVQSTAASRALVRISILLLLAAVLAALAGCGGGGDDDLGLQLVALPADAKACPAQPFVGPLPTWCVDTAGQPAPAVPPVGKPQ